MRISIKTLKGNHFDIQVNSNDTIADVKKTIEDVQGVQIYPADRQALIYKGKILKDTTTLEENDVVDDSFIVVMLNKPRTAAPGSSSASAVPAAQAQTQTPIPQTSSTPLTQSQAAPGSVAAPAAVVPPSSGEANVYDQAASNLVAGSGLESTIQQILDMGGGSWDRDTVLRALRAAFNNPERAVEYLYSGIPEQAEVPQVARAVAAAPATPAGGQATVPPAQVPQVAAPSGVPNASPLDLFPQGIPNVGSNAAGTGSLDFLRNSQQFQALRSMVQSNPQILQPMLQELGKQNPHLMRLIQEHQNDFVRLMNEPVEGGDAGNLLSQLGAAMPAMPPTLSITPEEHEAVERLQAMGFRRETVLQVYFACNKDETLAANYLVDHMDELMNEDEEALS